MRDDRVYLKHILECIRAVEEYTVSGSEVFLQDRKTQKAVLRELQELAESTQRLSTILKESYPKVPWRSISGFRNVLVHDYLGVNLRRIQEIIERDLPALRAAAEKMLSELDDTAP